MKKLFRALFIAAVACGSVAFAGQAAAEPASKADSQLLCLSLQSVAAMAVEEARTRPDQDILSTKMYRELISDDSIPEVNELFRSALVFAWDVYQLGVSSHQAGEVIRNTCMKAPAV